MDPGYGARALATKDPDTNCAPFPWQGMSYGLGGYPSSTSGMDGGLALGPSSQHPLPTLDSLSSPCEYASSTMLPPTHTSLAGPHPPPAYGLTSETMSTGHSALEALRMGAGDFTLPPSLSPPPLTTGSTTMVGSGHDLADSSMDAKSKFIYLM